MIKLTGNKNFYILFGVILLFASCTNEFEKLEVEEECKLTSQIPVSIIYERFDVNRQYNIISCYHIPLQVRPSDTTTCIYQFDKRLLTDQFGFYFLNINEPEKTRLFGAQILAPVWSPDGEWLLWSNNENLFTAPIQADTLDFQNVVQITYENAILEEPKWSPDQQKILFRSRSAPDTSDFSLVGYYTIDVEGSNAKFTGFDADDVAWKDHNQLFVLNANQIVIFDIENQTEETFIDIPSGFSSIRNLKLNPFDQKLYFIAKDDYDQFLSLYSIDQQTLQIEKVFGKAMLDYGFGANGELILLYIEDQISQIGQYDRSANFFEVLYSYEEI